MKLQIIVILFLSIGIAAGIAQVSEEFVSITVTADGKTKVSQTLFPKTFVSSIDVDLISERISNLLAIDEKNIILGTTQNDQLLKIASLGASQVDLRYDAAALSYESGVFRLKYSSDIDSKVNLPPLSKLVSLNTIPNEITDEEYSLPPGDISLSYTIRPVTSKEFSVNIDGNEQKVEAITAAKIDEFSASNEQIRFIIKDKAVILTIIPKNVLDDPNHTTLNGEDVEFSQFHQNSTHSWIRIDPHEKGLVKITDNSEKIEEGGGCLIATATFGSELAPQVQQLREIRDNQLLNSHSGTAFMTGFNQIYYSFSPTIADIQRENQIVNEIVKIAITPMISSLSLMTSAESEEEILGIGVGIILLNVGMYFVIPFWIFYFVRRNFRTRSKNNSNRLDIFSCYVRKALKTSLFGIIALLVLTVSLSSAFNQTAFADDEDPIKTILEITYQNILESREDVGEVPDTAETFFLAGQENYDEALEALENGDIVTAKEKAIVAMALFEDAAEEIGSLEDQASTQLPPGFGAAGDNPNENNNGQGLGVGGIPLGQAKKFDDIYSVYSPDDYFDDPIDDLIEDQFEDKYDMMNKNSKAKEKQIKENNDRLLKAKGNQGGGNPNCDNEGIEGLDALSDSGLMGEDYTISGLTAVGSNCKDVTGQIRITIDGPSSPPAEHNNESQPFTFQPDEAGTWTIQAAATGQFSSKTVTVAGVEACENCDNQNQYSVRDGDPGVIDATVFTAPSKTISSVLWEDVPTGDDGDMVNLFNSTSSIDVSFTAPSNTGGPDIYNMTLTVTFTDLTTAVDWMLVRVTN